MRTVLDTRHKERPRTGELMKVVLDTNIFISGIFWEGNFSSRIIGLWRKGRIELVSSLPIVEELVRTL